MYLRQGVVLFFGFYFWTGNLLKEHRAIEQGKNTNLVNAHTPVFFIFLGHVPSSTVFVFFWNKKTREQHAIERERVSSDLRDPSCLPIRLLTRPNCCFRDAEKIKDSLYPIYLYIYIRTWLHYYIWQYIIFYNPPFQSLSIGSIHLGSSGVRNWKRKTRMLRSNLPQAPSGHAAEKESDWWLVRSNKMSEA